MRISPKHKFEQRERDYRMWVNEDDEDDEDESIKTITEWEKEEQERLKSLVTNSEFQTGIETFINLNRDDLMYDKLELLEALVIHFVNIFNVDLISFNNTLQIFKKKFGTDIVLRFDETNKLQIVYNNTKVQNLDSLFDYQQQKDDELLKQLYLIAMARDTKNKFRIKSKNIDLSKLYEKLSVELFMKNYKKQGKIFKFFLFYLLHKKSISTEDVKNIDDRYEFDLTIKTITKKGKYNKQKICLNDKTNFDNDKIIEIAEECLIKSKTNIEKVIDSIIDETMKKTQEIKNKFIITKNDITKFLWSFIANSKLDENVKNEALADVDEEKDESKKNKIYTNDSSTIEEVKTNISKRYLVNFSLIAP